MSNSITFSAAPGKTIPEDVRRCLSMLYATREGEQALDRAFGISWDAVDAPPYVARALLTQEIIAKTRRYEPRAQILRVDYDEPDLSGTLAARVTLEVVDT